VFPTSHSRAFSVCLLICCSNSRSMIIIFISISYCYKFTSWCLSHPTVKAWLVSLYGFFPICNIFSSCQYWVEIFISLSFIYYFSVHCSLYFYCWACECLFCHLTRLHISIGMHQTTLCCYFTLVFHQLNHNFSCFKVRLFPPKKMMIFS